MRPILLIHGWGGSGPGHWQNWLSDELAAEGIPVDYPVLPDADTPNLNVWLATLEAVRMCQDQPPDVIAHSLGAVTVLHWIERTNGRNLFNRVLLVSPPSPRNAAPEVASFLPIPCDLMEKVRSACASVSLIGAKDDPFARPKDFEAYGQVLGVQPHLFETGGHLNAASGYGRWPWITAWARGNDAGTPRPR